MKKNKSKSRKVNVVQVKRRQLNAGELNQVYGGALLVDRGTKTGKIFQF